MTSSQFVKAASTAFLMKCWMSDINAMLPAVDFGDLPEHFQPSMCSDDGSDVFSPVSTHSSSIAMSSSGQSTPRSSLQMPAQWSDGSRTQPRHSAPSIPFGSSHGSMYGVDQMRTDEAMYIDCDVFDDIDWSAQGAEVIEDDESNGHDDGLRCWDHGCNGRKFTTRSNLCRHKRENSAARPKYYCPRCGAVFSRAASRDVHLEKLSCDRIRRYSNGRQRPGRAKKHSVNSRGRGAEHWLGTG